MNKRTKVLDIRGLLKRSWWLKSRVGVTNEHQKPYWVSIVKKDHIKLIEVRILLCRIPTQFKLLKILVWLIIVINFYQGVWWWLHVKRYYPCIPLLLVWNVLCGSVVSFVFVSTRIFICKVSHTPCISKITRRNIVDNIMCQCYTYLLGLKENP